MCEECGRVAQDAISYSNGMHLYSFCSTRCITQWERKKSPQGIINAERWPESYFTDEQTKVIGKWELELPQYYYATSRE